MKIRKSREGSILVDTLVTVLLCAVFFSAVLPVISRSLRLGNSISEKTDSIIANSEAMW